MRSGIYEIKCIVNSMPYVGQTIDIDRRWVDHLKELNNGTHHSLKLQSDFNNYGIKAFSFTVLKECDIEFLNLFEAYYIELFNSVEDGYNTRNVDQLVRGEKRRVIALKTLGKAR